MDTFYIYDIVYVINPRKMFCLKPRLCFFVFPAVLQVVVSSLSSQTASRTSSTPVLAAKRTSAPSRRSDPGPSAVTGGGGAAVSAEVLVRSCNRRKCFWTAPSITPLFKWWRARKRGAQYGHFLTRLIRRELSIYFLYQNREAGLDKPGWNTGWFVGSEVNQQQEEITD